MTTPTQPMLSVCVFAYNHEKYIAKALDSILFQQVKFEFEVIVAEDYSTDSTLQIVENYQARYPTRIRVVQSGKREKLFINGQQTAIYNYLSALNSCKGKYIAFLDGDDYWLSPDKLQKQVNYLESNKDCSLVFHNVYTQQSEEQSKLSRTYLHDSFPDNLDLRSLLIQRNYIPTSSVVLRNNIPSIFPKIFYTCIFGDWPLYIYSLNFGSPAYMKEVMSVYRVGSGVWTKKKKIDQLIPILDFYAQVGEIIPKDIRPLLPRTLAKFHRTIAWEYLKERRFVLFATYFLKGAWKELCLLKRTEI